MNSDNEFKERLFRTANARLLSDSAGFALWSGAPPVVGGVPGGHGVAKWRSGAVQTRPPTSHCGDAALWGLRPRGRGPPGTERQVWCRFGTTECREALERCI